MTHIDFRFPNGERMGVLMQICMWYVVIVWIIGIGSTEPQQGFVVSRILDHVIFVDRFY